MLAVIMKLWDGLLISTCTIVSVSETMAGRNIVINIIRTLLYLLITSQFFFSVNGMMMMKS